METNRSEKRSASVKAVPIFIVLAAAAALAEPTYSQGVDPGSIQDEIVSVSCFKGNLDAGNYVGSLTVTTPQNAGKRCNSVYSYDCQGVCLGCFTDNLGAQVCYDNEGQKFPK